MSAAIHLHDHERALSLFAQGITGAVYHVRSEREFKGTGGTHRAGEPLHDRNVLYLPERLERFEHAWHNRSLYRLMALHQIGHLEFGSYRFDIHHARERLMSLAQRPPPQVELPESDFDTLYRHFPVPALARLLFRLLESARIDRQILRHYPGARRDFERIAAFELAERRPLPAVLELADVTEALLRWRLGEGADALTERDATGAMVALLEEASVILGEAADVYHSAGALAGCYRIIEEAGLCPSRADMPAAHDETGDGEGSPGASEAASPEEGARHAEARGERSEPRRAFEPDPVAFEGHPPAEWLQREERLADWRARHEALSEELRQQQMGAAAGQRGQSRTAGQSLEIGETRSAGAGSARRRQEIERDTLERRIGIERFRIDQALGRGEHHHGPSFLYDEWDSIAGRYLPGWCRLYEERSQERAEAPIRAMLERVAPHQAAVRKRFEQVKPLAYERTRRMADGEELDLERLIDYRTDTRHGRSPDERVYARRDRVNRDVATAFLVDLSASTDDPLAEPGQAGAAENDPPRRIIDVQRESLLLMARALETLRDPYAIYGFSGYGRDNVEFSVVKDFGDSFGYRTLGALAAMRPRRSTRMGPAIRHSIRKLRTAASALKLLIVVSDGFPQDCDYGPDRADHSYGVEDTAKALGEARLAGIETFCVTVDRAGHDYLKRMCPEERYLIIEELEALPEALSKVYRRLTGR